MMTVVIAGVAAVLSPAALPAQEVTAAPTAAVSTAPATSTFSADTPIETLAADPAAKAILERDVPSLLSHPSYDAIKGMSLRQIQPYSNGALTDAIIDVADKHLRAIAAN